MKASDQVRLLQRAIFALNDARSAIAQLDQNDDLYAPVMDAIRIGEDWLEDQRQDAHLQEPGWQDVCFGRDAPSPARSIDFAAEVL